LQHPPTPQRLRRHVTHRLRTLHRPSPPGSGSLNSPPRFQGIDIGETPLHRQKTATVTDRQPIRVDYPHKELVTRLLADVCEVCQQPGEVEVHHVRKLTDLGKPGPLQPHWAKAMANRRRKTLVVCASCHSLTHTGQPATPLTQ
ncbi:hypothetical protein ABGB16_33950, partial [Micromonospora sp. B11E3]